MQKDSATKQRWLEQPLHPQVPRHAEYRQAGTHTSSDAAPWQHEHIDKEACTPNCV